MNYLSTRNKDLRMSAAQAIAKGLAPDGGLMTPAVLPRLPSTAMETMREMSYQQRVIYIMNSFLEGFSGSELTTYASEAYGGGKFSHPDVAPVHKLDDNTYCLELWHGPTCAFKDMAQPPVTPARPRWKGSGMWIKPKSLCSIPRMVSLTFKSSKWSPRRAATWASVLW